MAKTVLEVQGIWKVYQMDSIEVPALRGLSLKIKEGEFVAIVGASGSGKSTVLNIIGALDVPTKGLVFLNGIEITKLSESKLARLRGKTIGFVFQTFNLYPTLNVFDNIALPMKIHEFDPVKIEKKVNGLAKLVGLEHRVNHLPAQLSGGERQRVALARALSAEPALILADEPTGNLDTKTSREIMGLLADLHKKQGKTIILVTHEPSLAQYAGRIIELRDGKILYDKKNKKKGNVL